MTATPLLSNFVAGRWQAGSGAGTPLFDPVTGAELVRVDATGLDLAEAFSFAREQGGAALRALTYKQRAVLLSAAVQVLQANRDAYYEIATCNSGTVKNDSAVDIDGGIFTLGSYAKLGDGLGERHSLLDGEALLSGVPVIVKPATTTAWLTQRMVQDVVDAGIFPLGALSVVCGSAAGLMDQLQPFDVVSFTGSAETAAVIRSHPAVTQRSVRVNIEADSVNSALLLPDTQPGSAALDLFVKEVAREMTVKSGQKCTAIRRALVPQALYAEVAAALAARLAKTTVGNPRNDTVRMGALVNRAQLATVQQGLHYLGAQTEVLHDGGSHALVDADAATACCVGPTLLGTRSAAGSDAADRVHDTEVFGPVATLLPYRSDAADGQDGLAHALQLVRRGQGSLVVSLYGEASALLARAAQELADSHGRVHIITPDVAALQTGHGNVMPQSLHGGPGRAGGGEELGGLRALNFYHRRSALQASTAVLDLIKNGADHD